MNDIERRDFWERELVAYVESLNKHKSKQQEDNFLKIESEQLILKFNEKVSK